MVFFNGFTNVYNVFKYICVIIHVKVGWWLDPNDLAIANAVESWYIFLNNCPNNRRITSPPFWHPLKANRAATQQSDLHDPCAFCQPEAAADEVDPGRENDLRP